MSRSLAPLATIVFQILRLLVFVILFSVPSATTANTPTPEWFSVRSSMRTHFTADVMCFTPVCITHCSYNNTDFCNYICCPDLSPFQASDTTVCAGSNSSSVSQHYQQPSILPKKHTTSFRESEHNCSQNTDFSDTIPWVLGPHHNSCLPSMLDPHLPSHLQLPVPEELPSRGLLSLQLIHIPFQAHSTQTKDSQD